MSFAASRAVIRQSHLTLRRSALRNASTTSEAASNTASKAKDTASNATSRASQGLSRVTSSAGSGISRATEGISNALGRMGARTGRMIAFVQSMVPPTIYYSRVGLELGRLVFQGQKMSPPNMQTLQSYFQPLINAARNPMSAFSGTANSNAMSPEHLLSRVRNVSRQEMTSGAIVACECLGFFTVGEMLGRMKVVGYHGDREHHETATPHQ